MSINTVVDLAQDMGPTQPCSLSLTAFPYSSASEEEPETLQRPVSPAVDATSSPPQATRKYYSPPPLTRYSIQDAYSQHSGQPYESDQISEALSSIGQSPKLSAQPLTIRRPLVLYPLDGTVQDKKGAESFSGSKKKTQKKAKQVLRPWQKLHPSFVNLVKGVCEIFEAQTGKKPTLEKVCASFY